MEKKDQLCIITPPVYLQLQTNLEKIEKHDSQNLHVAMVTSSHTNNQLSYRMVARSINFKHARCYSYSKSTQTLVPLPRLEAK